VILSLKSDRYEPFIKEDIQDIKLYSRTSTIHYEKSK